MVPAFLFGEPPVIRYSGLQLDEASRVRLRELYTDLVKPGGMLPAGLPDWSFIGDHVTLALGQLPELLQHLLDKPYQLRAVAAGLDPQRKALALKVAGVARQDGVQPHVTLALAPGAQAADSKDVVDWSHPIEPVNLQGIVRQVVDETDPRTEGVTNLEFFDFDGTLVDTPEPEEGMRAYQAHYGQPYPHTGWWGRPESLDLAIWPMKRLPTIYPLYRRARSRADSRLILLTNRVGKLQPQVAALLAKHGMRLDALTFRQSSETKGDRVAAWLDAVPTVTTVHVLDDHPDQLAAVRAIEGRYPHVTFTYTLADRQALPPGMLRESLARMDVLLTNLEKNA